MEALKKIRDGKSYSELNHSETKEIFKILSSREKAKLITDRYKKLINSIYDDIEKHRYFLYWNSGFINISNDFWVSYYDIEFKFNKRITKDDIEKSVMIWASNGFETFNLESCGHIKHTAYIILFRTKPK